MSIWPYRVRRVVELPCTLANVLAETTPRLWLAKVDFIERYCCMALIGSHPDWLRNDTTWRVHTDFLQDMKARDGYWHALPQDVARWWR